MTLKIEIIFFIIDVHYSYFSFEEQFYQILLL